MAGDERVTFVLAAKDQATATVKRLKGELNTMGGTAAKASGPLGKLSAVTGGLVTPASLAVAGTAALGAAFLGAARAAMDEERGVALLTAALKANDPASAGNIENIEATIRERQKLAFADDEQRESLGALIAVTKDSGKALDLQRTAMDLARLKGMSLADASTLIGKVYGGNLGILSRYGIQLKKGTTATEALAEIQKRAAGQAEEYADTTSGAMESMSLTFDDVVEDIGKLLLPAMRDIALFVRDTLIPAIRDLAPIFDATFGNVGRGIENVARSFREAAGDIHFFAMNFGEQGNVVHQLAERVGVDFDTMKDRIRDRMVESGESFTTAVNHITTEANRMADNAEGAAHDGMGRMAAGIRAGEEAVATEAAIIADIPRKKMVEAYQALRQSAYQSQVEVAKGLIDGQNAPKVAMDAAMQLLEEELTDEQEIVRLKGQKLTLETAAGVASKEGKDAAKIAIDAALQVVTDRMAFLQTDFYKSGYNIGVAWANGLRDAADYARLMAWELAASANPALHGLSPPKEGPLKDIDKGGFNIGLAWAKGLAGAAQGAKAASHTLAAAAMPAFASAGTSYSSPAPAYASAGGTFTINVNAPLGTPAAGQALARVILPELMREQQRQGLR